MLDMYDGEDLTMVTIMGNIGGAQWMKNLLMGQHEATGRHAVTEVCACSLVAPVL